MTLGTTTFLLGKKREEKGEGCYLCSRLKGEITLPLGSFFKERGKCSFFPSGHLQFYRGGQS